MNPIPLEQATSAETDLQKKITIKSLLSKIAWKEVYGTLFAVNLIVCGNNYLEGMNKATDVLLPIKEQGEWKKYAESQSRNIAYCSVPFFFLMMGESRPTNSLVQQPVNFYFAPPIPEARPPKHNRRDYDSL